MEQKATFKDYNEALERNVLLGMKCNACGALTVPPKMVCRQCASPDVAITEVAGDGTIKTLTTVFVASEGREDEVPYILVMVETDAGPWVLGNLDGIEPEKADNTLIGRQVKMGHQVFHGDKYSAGPGARPVFTLAG